MNGNKILIAVLVAVVVVAGLFFAMSGEDNPPGQQPSPHAINQPD